MIIKCRYCKREFDKPSYRNQHEQDAHNVCQARLEHGEWVGIPLDCKAVALANDYEVRTEVYE